MSYLHTKFHDNWISSFRGVAMTRFWDGRTDRQTDGVTALLDLLSPSATQVKNLKGYRNVYYRLLKCFSVIIFPSLAMIRGDGINGYFSKSCASTCVNVQLAKKTISISYDIWSSYIKLNSESRITCSKPHTWFDIDSRAYLILWLWQLFQRTRGDHNVYTVSFWCLDACVKGEDNCVSKTINISTQDVNIRWKHNTDNRNGKKTFHTYSLITFFFDIRFKFLTWYRHISLSTSLDVMHKWASYKNTNYTTT